MTDNERELHIKSCGRLMEQAMGNYEASGSFHDIADAHAWRMAMEAAIKARTPQKVARMEEQLGLA